MIGSAASSSLLPLAIGFTVNADAASPNQFEADIAHLRATGANWIRFGVQHWDMGGWFGGRFYWKQANLDFLRSCVQAAKRAGLRISFTLAAMPDSPAWSFDEYLRINRLYWGRITTELAAAGGVDVLQVYNEHDAAHFRSQQPLAGAPSAAYLTSLATALRACRNVSRIALPSTPVTTAVTGVTVDANTELRWQHFYDVVAPSVDLLGVNCYPGDWMEQIERLPDRLGRLRSRYAKPVIVTEIGLPTEQGGAIALASAKVALPEMIAQAARAAPVAVLVYQLRNSGKDPYDPEQNFGIYTQDFKARPTRDAVVSAIHSY